MNKIKQILRRASVFLLTLMTVFTSINFGGIGLVETYAATWRTAPSTVSAGTTVTAVYSDFHYLNSGGTDPEKNKLDNAPAFGNAGDIVRITASSAYAQTRIVYWSVDDATKKWNSDASNTQYWNSSNVPFNGTVDLVAPVVLRWGVSSAGATVTVQVISGTPAHSHTYGSWTYHSDSQHKRVCSGDSSHVEYGAHAGGTASCTAKAVCTVCGASYGALKSHSYE